MIRRHNSLSILLAGVIFISLKVLGQTPAEVEETRRKMMDEADAASQAENHSQALSLAIRAGEIRMTPSLRRFIAEEQYEVGQFMGSMTSAEQCVGEAQAAKVLKHRQEILRACRSLIAELQRVAARIIISISDPVPPDTQVMIGGQKVPAALYGLPYLHKAGEIHVTAEASGRISFQRDLVLGPGQEATVTVLLPPAPPAVQASESREVTPVLPETETSAAKATSETVGVSAEKQGRNVGPYVTLGIGAVSLGTAGVFLILRNNAMNDLKAQCVPGNPTVCPDTPEAHSLQSKASTYNTLTNVALVAGGAAVVGGAIWLLLDKGRSSATPPRAELQIIPTEGGALVGVVGAL
jgi:hypothetical protein